MYLEVVANPGIEELQLCCVPTSPHPADPDRDAVRIVVVFTTVADATMALPFASRLCAKRSYLAGLPGYVHAARAISAGAIHSVRERVRTRVTGERAELPAISSLPFLYGASPGRTVKQRPRCRAGSDPLVAILGPRRE